jgi:hypothetical protein
MPKFIGNQARDGSIQIHDNALQNEDLVRLTYSQQKLLPASDVRYSLDTTDRGSKGTYAKRWYRWFTSRETITQSKRATQSMLTRAHVAGPTFFQE